jgi:hypothetical protein
VIRPGNPSEQLSMVFLEDFQQHFPFKCPSATFFKSGSPPPAGRI